MSRGLSRALEWRQAYWTRVAPGPFGAAAFALLPLLFFLPLHSLSIFGQQMRGVAVLTWMFSLALALSIRAGGTLRDEASLWPLQKGFCQGEMALEDWILDVGLLGLACLWWASLGVLAIRQPGEAWGALWIALFSLGLTTAALAHAFTLFLSAHGVTRPSDLAILLAILSLLAPVLGLGAPAWVPEAVELVLPPFRVALELHGAVRRGDPPGMVRALLHLSVFSGLVLWVGVRRIARWRPRA